MIHHEDLDKNKPNPKLSGCKKYKNLSRNKWNWNWKMQNINKTKSCFFPKKLNKIDKLLARLTKTKVEPALINKIWDEKGDILTCTAEMQASLEATMKNMLRSWKILKKLVNL